MVNTILKHNIEWQAPIPLWAESYKGTGEASKSIKVRPAILRFADDSFMDELLALMKQTPWRIKEWIAQPETWREPMQQPKGFVNQDKKQSLSEFLVQKGLSREKVIEKKKEQNKKKLAYPGNDAVWHQLPLKLYQPAHKRYYVVTASLIQNEYGYPDKKLNMTRREKSSFVVRRLVAPENLDVSSLTQTPSNWDEYAYIKTEQGGKWKKLTSGLSKGAQYLATSEEQLPLFPISYADKCGHSRQTFNGLIPVGKREEWLAAGTTSGSNSNYDNQEEYVSVERSLAYSILVADVIAPWKSIISDSFDTFNRKSEEVNTFDGLIDLPNEQNNIALGNFVRAARERIQTTSWYVLLDLQKYLEKYLPKIWDVIAGNENTHSLNNAEKTLIKILQDTKLSNDLIDALTGAHYSKDDVISTLFDALRAIKAEGFNLEAVDVPFELKFDENGNPVAADSRWPAFLFPLTDPDYGSASTVISSGSKALIPPVSIKNTTAMEIIFSNLDEFANLVASLLPEEVTQKYSNDLLETQPVMDQKEAWFVVRCVYERPNCGPVFPALVSESTRPFQIAAFFDPDAPQRPIKIAMPVDISPAGLRKYSKNVGFVMSDMLCGKIKAIRGLGFVDLVLSVLPWPFHKDLPDIGGAGPCKGSGGNFGMICSLSIPIVTLCALVLLIIMVSLFNIFFYWLPLLFLCLPIPGLKAK